MHIRGFKIENVVVASQETKDKLPQYLLKLNINLKSQVTRLADCTVCVCCGSKDQNQTDIGNKVSLYLINTL